MTLTLVGLSHRTAPIELRERVYIGPADAPSAVRDLVASPAVEECVALSTCNRTELYLYASDQTAAERVATEEVARRAGLTKAEMEPYLYFRSAYECVLHLFRVAAGLDSLVLGEAEILGQVAGAYEAGKLLPGGVGPVFHRLFQMSLAAGGAVRTETRLGQGAASIPSAAMRLAVKVFGSLEGRSSMVLGTGDMGVTTLRCLLAEGISEVLVANRTPERARQTVERLGGRAVSMEEFWRRLADTDVLVTCTSATEPLVGGPALAVARGEATSPLVILDIALPRDVEPAAGELASVFLYNIDDLQKVIGATEAARRAEMLPAEDVVAAHARRFWRWYRTRHAAPLIHGLRTHGEAVRRDELARLLESLEGLSRADRDRVAASTKRLLNKLLHPPTLAVRQAASDPDGLEFLDRLRVALGLAREAEDEVLAEGDEAVVEDGEADSHSEETNEARKP